MASCQIYMGLYKVFKILVSIWEFEFYHKQQIVCFHWSDRFISLISTKELSLNMICLLVALESNIFYCFIKNRLKGTKILFFWSVESKQYDSWCSLGHTEVLTALTIIVFVSSVQMSTQQNHELYFNFGINNPVESQGFPGVNGTHFEKYWIKIFKQNKCPWKPHKIL